MFFSLLRAQEKRKKTAKDFRREETRYREPRKRDTKATGSYFCQLSFKEAVRLRTRWSAVVS